VIGEQIHRGERDDVRIAALLGDVGPAHRPASAALVDDDDGHLHELAGLEDLLQAAGGDVVQAAGVGRRDDLDVLLRTPGLAVGGLRPGGSENQGKEEKFTVSVAGCAHDAPSRFWRS
jgi:hypothetical protein